MKSYREQYRSLNFLSFISKKVKIIPGSWASQQLFFSKQMSQKETEKDKLYSWGKKGKRRGKVYLLAQERHFLQPAS